MELEGAGAYVIRSPAIRVEPPETYDALDASLGQIDEYRWLVFTSSNGVRAVMCRMAELGLSSSSLDSARIAAVGAATARALERHGIYPGFVPRIERSRALAESLTPVEGESILLARADIADPSVVETLRRRGAERVDDVAVYRTVLLRPSQDTLEELRRGVDGITFTSPSTIRGFLEIGPESRDLLDGVVVASLGPATTEVAREAGIEIDAEAVERSMAGLVEALGAAFAARASREESVE
jgi:uroporphyrinogen III methyltransferase/synthase